MIFLVCLVPLGLLVLPYFLSSPGLSAFRTEGGPYLDVHVHTAGVGAGKSGIYLAPKLSESYKRWFYLRAFGVSDDELEREGDGLVVRKISEQIASSQLVSKAVVLALDGVVTNGALDLGKTEIFVPNEFVAREVRKYSNLLFGASVNPYRAEALSEVQRVKQDGAVLIKWIPNIMHIDPADEAIIPFYRELVRLGLPLLVHTGQERSFVNARDEFGDPVRLELPLKLGVRVIAAHVATTGAADGVEMFERIMPLFEKYPNLYADISSLTQLNKLGYLAQVVKKKEIHSRLVYGSDWPLQFFPLVSPWFQIRHVSFWNLFTLCRIKNQWDRDVALKMEMGVPIEVFRRSEQILQ